MLTKTCFSQNIYYSLRLPLVFLSECKNSNTVKLGFYVFSNALDTSQKDRTVALRYSLPVPTFLSLQNESGP